MRRPAVLGSRPRFAGRSRVSPPPQAPGRIGLSLVGHAQIPAGFKHFDYVNPDAPKGGTMKLSAIGTYDTLNPFIIKGVPAAGIGQTFDTLMTPAEDEADTEYGLVAESVEIAPDKMSVLYTMRPEARFHDGSPMTPDDFDLDLRDAARQGPAALPHLLRRRDQGDEGGRARRPLHLQERRTTTNCRKSSARCRCCRKSTGAARISRRRRSTRRSAAAPTRSSRSIPAARSPIAASPITGPRICRQQGPLQRRHDPLRLLPRRHRGAGGVQGRAIRSAPGKLVESLGHRL